MTSRNRIDRGLLRIVARRLAGLALVLAVAAAALPNRALAAAPTTSPATIDGVRLRRFALMAGFNDGGPTLAAAALRGHLGRARDELACSRAWAVIAPDDIVFVSDAYARRTSGRVRPPGPASMAAGQFAPGHSSPARWSFYYSGHSDEDGLLIGNDRVSYDELRARIQGIPAEVRLAILDSCASGAFTRRKGGVRRAPFMMDGSADTKGHAYLASSAINEAAQESDRIGASFFTHYLVSGLRGAADVIGDRR